MLIKKFFYRELVSNATKIFIVLVPILPVTELFKLLNQTSSSSVSIATIVTVMLYGTIASFPMVLTISCFLTVVVTIGRYCKDHEFIIWWSSGLSLFYWLRQVLYFIIPMTVICAICTVYVTPWATGKSQDYANFLSKQQLAMIISPGVFRENSNGDQVLYIERYSLALTAAQNIFVQYIEKDGISYNITAKEGKIDNNAGIIGVTLFNGHRNELGMHDGNILQLNFSKLHASIKQDYQPLDKSHFSSPTSTITQLLNKHNGSALSELSWRISIALMMLMMALIAVPVSVQIGRMQNNFVFILAPIIYAIYENTILSINSFVSAGNISLIWCILLVHLSMLAITLGITYIKNLPHGFMSSGIKSTKWQ